MKPSILFILLLLLLPVSVAIQDLLPSLPPSQERIQLLPVLFCFGALALPLVPALYFGLAAGVVQGLALLQSQSGQAELGLCLPILFFLGWAIILQMASEATRGMRWELHSLGSALTTLSLIGGEFLVLCLKRGGLPIDETVMLRIAAPSAAALLISPILYFSLRSLVPFSLDTPTPKKQLSFDR